jgi:phage terminase large subunit
VVERCILRPGSRIVCVREIQKTLAQSSKLLIETKIADLGVGEMFRILNDKIETPGGGLIIFQGMQDHTAKSIKSLEGYHIAWIEEAQTLSARSLSLLRPTIRAAGSEIWAAWNPTRKVDAIDDFLRNKKPEGSIVVRANWSDNPWFPPELEAERKLDYNLYPDRYAHIWEGEYATAFEGAYFSKLLMDAKNEGRIGNVATDPLLQLRAYWDIGGAGAKADANSVWVVWIEEAQTLSARSLSPLRPTIRAAGSEIWAAWNPTRTSATSGCEQSQQIASYSITSSARARKDSGIVRPTAFAALTLTTSSNLVA